jgi:hypothetical protein
MKLLIATAVKTSNPVQVVLISKIRREKRLPIIPAFMQTIKTIFK